MNSISNERSHHDILNIFATEKSSEHGFLRVSAPMVRYSKLEFRKLLRQNGVKLCFTPMIVADSFNRSEKARQNEFTTTFDDNPLIAQFAACGVQEFVTGAQLIYPYVDGVDLNCGCPQSWAIAKGYGCGLLRKPEIVHDIVQEVRRTLPSNFSVSVKLRLLNGQSVESTIELARQLEMCGVTFLTIHGRTAWQRTSDPLNIPAMAELKQSLRIPLIVNGNVQTWQDAVDLHNHTAADGVMAARGLLANPALFNPAFKDVPDTTLTSVQQWLDIAAKAEDNLTFQCFHHHLVFMWSSHMNRKLRVEFNNFTKKQQILDFFKERYDLSPLVASDADNFDYTDCTYEHVNMVQIVEDSLNNDTWNADTNGKFFNEFSKEMQDDALENDEFELGNTFFTELE
ncbi:tRNA-dihydrouridine(20a/20b) synthase [NAD(P)+]-like [Teleopsis dalmanni]|uniref:tRNA-dihydrouridine(20a/20b) synthase [NAD(P)+]-like n=1 Tax=Teleopsis dalmanni TaxID=139649 RepID=UPI0018CED9A1|nr:tRNA-dihydrouridine(20a/20b) synthase [NAD(P)+]-like [Teleopsis dalmanni]